MRPPDFLIIPYALIDDQKLQPLDQKLYGVIYWLERLRGERCFATNTTLAILLKTTRGTIKNSLSRLEKRGYILRSYEKDFRVIKGTIYYGGGHELLTASKHKGGHELMTYNNNNYKKRKGSFKKPFYRGEEMRFAHGKWWVLPKEGGSWLEFADKENKIEWQ